LLTNEDLSIHDLDQDDLVVATAIIANWRFHKIFIYQGTLVDVLYLSTFQKLDFPNHWSSPIQILSKGSREKVYTPEVM